MSNPMWGKLLRANQTDLRRYASNIRHAIKYENYDSIDYLYQVAEADVLQLNKSYFRRAVIIATIVQVAFELKGIYRSDVIPKWVLSSKVKLEKPYFSPSSQVLDFLSAYCSEYNHNVFFPKSAHDVL